jgi:hypothetical protein
MPSSGQPGLRVVRDTQPLDEGGDDEKTLEAMDEWTSGQRKCRARRGRHVYVGFTAYEHRTYIDVVQQCSICKSVRRRATFRRVTWGKRPGLRQLTDWKPVYRDSNGKSYLLPKGAARITRDSGFQEYLNAQEILSGRIIRVPDDEDDDDAE